MKGKWKRKYGPIIVTALSLSLGLVACGGAETTESTGSEDVAGEDWRTTGVVVGKGTIVRDGESITVLATVDPMSAAFFRDQFEPEVVDSVNFPEEFPEIGDCGVEFTFDDFDGDGQTDVELFLQHPDMTHSNLVWYWDAADGYVYQPALSNVYVSDVVTEPENDDLLADYIGLWEYVGANRWLRVHDDGTWEFVNDQDEVIEYGTLLADEDGLTLEYAGSDEVMYLDRSESGELMDILTGGALLPVEEIRSQAAYFERNGLDIEGRVDQGTYLLEGGVSSYVGLGEGYNRGDCYWEVTKKYDQTHDGIRELQFDAICYIPQGAITVFPQDYITVTSSELYDYYTGMWLTAATAYGSTERGENYYLHTINRDGESEQIEFAYSTDWQYNVGDWAQVLTKSYVAYVPEDYDGLVFAAQAEPWDYKDDAKRMQLDSIAPEADVMNLPTLAPYSSLYFRICE